jgi:ubiquinol-cytochrome c reductase cytochrome b subunit
MDILSIIFGSLLGDAHGEKRVRGPLGGTRITFYQEGSHQSYLLYLHNLIADKGYCNSNIPVISTRLVKDGKIRKIIRFSTWTYTSLNWIHELWYDKGIKRVPKSIGYYLTPLALAIWIMDDGSKMGKTLKLSTNSYTYSDCLLLVEVLDKNFKLKASVQKAGEIDQFIVYIWKESMDDLRKLVSPYIVREMKYKINIK